METHVVYWAYKVGMADVDSQSHVGINKDFDHWVYVHKRPRKLISLERFTAGFASTVLTLCSVIFWLKMWRSMRR